MSIFRVTAGGKNRHVSLGPLVVGRASSKGVSKRGKGRRLLLALGELSNSSEGLGFKKSVWHLICLHEFKNG